VEKERSMGEDKSEVLVSIGADGRLTQWSIRKGFDSVSLMRLKRVIQPAPVSDKKTSMMNATSTRSKHSQQQQQQSHSGEAIITTYSPGLSFDFYSEDTNMYACLICIMILVFNQQAACLISLNFFGFNRRVIKSPLILRRVYANLLFCIVIMDCIKAVSILQFIYSNRTFMFCQVVVTVLLEYFDNSCSYLAATEDGLVHKCSCSYNEQYLDSYEGHTVSCIKYILTPCVHGVIITYFLSSKRVRFTRSHGHHLYQTCS